MDVNDDRPENLLLVPRDAKFRSYSTSTPYIHKQDTLKDLKIQRSSSTSVCSENDSGYGNSIVDVSTSTCERPFPTWTVCDTPAVISEQPTVCETPALSTSAIQGRWLHFSPSPLLKPKTNRVQSDIPSFHVESSPEDVLNFTERKQLDFELNLEDCPSGNNSTEKSTPKVEVPSTKDCLTDSILMLQFNEVLKKFSPSEPDRLIGRRVGLDSVDILTELNARNIHCVDTILRFLEPKDLCRLHCVSRDWKRICDSNARATKRRTKYLQQQRVKSERNKENPATKSAKRPSRSGLGVLQSISGHQPCQEQVHQTPRHKDTHEVFREAAQSLKNDETLQHCPRCRKPAKVLPVQDRALCTNKDCSYDYCIKCLCEFHGSRACVPLGIKRAKTDAIGSKKSKRNLRRL